MTRKKLIVLSLILSAVLGFSFYIIVLKQGRNAGPVAITIGGAVSDSGTPIFIAGHEGYFEKNGLKYVHKDYDTGMAAVNGVLKNEVDFARAAEYPVVVKAMEKAQISIIGSYARSFNEYIVGRVDKGIRKAADLKGKKIGLPLRTIPEFYLGRFLDLQGLSIKDVTLVNLTPKQTVGAIAEGRVDAVVVWEPYVSRIEGRMKDRTVKWLAHSVQPQYSVLVARNDWIKKNPDLVKRVLKSINQAEEYAAKNPAGAKAILQKRFKHDAAYVSNIWKEHQFYLFLDQGLVAAMEDEARWMMRNNLTHEKNMPNFLEYIYSDGLKAVRPEAVNIIR